MKKQIFNNQLVEELLIEYKKSKDYTLYQRICIESLNLMDSIIRSNNFYKQAPFHEIRNFLFTQFPRWVDNWKPGFKAYSYWCCCIKNGCISYVGKEANIRSKNVLTDAPLDSIGHEDDVSYCHYHLSDEDHAYLRDSITEIVGRWKEPIIRECLRYALTAVIQSRSDRRQEIIKSIVWGYDISLETAKFLLDWSLGAVRSALIDHYDSPIGEGDMIKLMEKYSFIPDMMNLIGLANTKKVMVVFAGMTVRFPTTVQIRKGMAVREVMNNNSYSPEGIANAAKKFKCSASKVQEGFEEMGANMQSGLLEDEPLFDGKEPEKEEEAEEEVDADSVEEVVHERTKDDAYFLDDFGGSEDDFPNYSYND